MSELKAQEDYHGREVSRSSVSPSLDHPRAIWIRLKEGLRFLRWQAEKRISPASWIIPRSSKTSVARPPSQPSSLPLTSSAATSVQPPPQSWRLGDSRCLLSRNWEPIPLSSDHKPEKVRSFLSSDVLDGGAQPYHPCRRYRHCRKSQWSCCIDFAPSVTETRFPAPLVTSATSWTKIWVQISNWWAACPTWRLSSAMRRTISWSWPATVSGTWCPPPLKPLSSCENSLYVSLLFFICRSPTKIQRRRWRNLWRPASKKAQRITWRLWSSSWMTLQSMASLLPLWVGLCPRRSNRKSNPSKKSCPPSCKSCDAFAAACL